MSLSPGVATIYGPPGTLKSSEAITWPAVLKMFDFDLGHQRAWEIDKKMANGEVIVEEVVLPTRSLTTRHQRLEGFMAKWQQFTKQFQEACEDPRISGIILDTATMLWSLIQDSYLEELQQVPSKDGTMRKQLQQFEFREPNGRMRTLFHTAKSNHKWLILVMHETDEYAPVVRRIGEQTIPVMDAEGRPMSAPSGNRIPDGFKYTVGLADWVFRARVDKKPDGTLSPAISIEKSAMGIDLVGVDIGYFEYEKLISRLEMLGRV